MPLFLDILREVWLLTGQMAPYLLLGFLVAGFLSAFISPQWVERHLGGRGWKPVAKSALFGVPLPLCSCGVIPVSASIRAQGASRGATVGFLLSTPQTGVDSILATYALLGPVYAVYRPLVALITGIIGGTLVSALVPDNDSPTDSTPEVKGCSDDCGQIEQHHDNRFLGAMKYGFITLPRDIAKALLVGIVVAGIIAALVPQDALGAYLGGGILAIIAMIAVGIPIYVCATASIPLALGFIHLGASPGAALAFLIAGPATNAATISVVWKVLGRRTAFIYFSAVAVAALFSGLLLDFIYMRLDASGFGIHHHTHHEATGGLGHLWSILLIAVLLISYLEPYLRKTGSTNTDQNRTDTPHFLRLNIEGMTCSHCVNTVTRALQNAPGVQSASVDLSTGNADIQGKDLDPASLIHTIDKLGYKASR
jgi:uncharacterized protein